MRYFKPGDCLLSDFDGVFLDSQDRYNEVMQGETALNPWMEYLNSIDWHSFLRQCNERPGASKTFLELQKLNILKGFITRIHSFEEGKEKSVILREAGLYVPIYYVLPEQPKSMVFQPNNRTIILEDDVRNTIDWEKNGGKSILYNPSAPISTEKEVKELSHLLLK